jgi:hypothetical protein
MENVRETAAIGRWSIRYLLKNWSPAEVFRHQDDPAGDRVRITKPWRFADRRSAR